MVRDRRSSGVIKIGHGSFVICHDMFDFFLFQTIPECKKDIRRVIDEKSPLV